MVQHEWSWLQSHTRAQHAPFSLNLPIQPIIKGMTRFSSFRKNVTWQEKNGGYVLPQDYRNIIGFGCSDLMAPYDILFDEEQGFHLKLTRSFFGITTWYGFVDFEHDGANDLTCNRQNSRRLDRGDFSHRYKQVGANGSIRCLTSLCNVTHTQREREREREREKQRNTQPQANAF